MKCLDRVSGELLLCTFSFFKIKINPLQPDSCEGHSIRMISRPMNDRLHIRKIPAEIYHRNAKMISQNSIIMICSEFYLHWWAAGSPLVHMHTQFVILRVTFQV